MKKVTTVTAMLSILFFNASAVFAHCELPCGIYGDQMRMDMITEHIITIEKAMKKIEELSADKDKNYNQIVRWITNKENHANELQDIVSQYFMTQRVKPAGDKDEITDRKLRLLHELLVYAMKAKQTTDQKYIEKLRNCLEDFRSVYFNKAELEHLRMH